MRLANVDGRATLLIGGGGIDVATASGGRLGPAVQPLYGRWDELRELAAAVDPADATPVDEATFGSPAPAPGSVFAIGLNYRAHAEETGMPVSTVPPTFTKYPSSLAGPFDDVVLPNDTVDWEVELVVVIGAPADRVAEADGWAHVAGLTVGQDLSDRTLQFAAGGQFSLGKSHRGFGPMGPVLVTPDELDDPDDLAIGCSIDGETVQDARTSDMVFSVPRLVAELSAVLLLRPGDVIFTGTPSGVGMGRTPPRYLRPGEVVESTVEGIGTIRNRMAGP